MNYAHVYADIPGPHHMGTVLHLAVTEPNSYTPPRATIRVGNGAIALEPDEMRRLSADLAKAADDVEQMRKEADDLAPAAEALAGEAEAAR